MSAQGTDVQRLPGGPWGQNAFLVSNGDAALVIDPGGNAADILAVLADRGLSLTAILNTHGHLDHIGAVVALVDATGAPFYISGKEAPIMKSSNMLRFIFKIREKVVVPSQWVDLDLAGGGLSFAGLHVECIATAGHTPGGYCFVIGHHLFSGDTLLRTAPASVDLPGGDRDALNRSLALLATLPRSLVLHPGHGRDTTLGDALDAVLEGAEHGFVIGHEGTS